MSINVIRTTIHHGRLELSVPADWPDGAEVEIRPVPMDDDEMSADEIARVLAAMDAAVPLDLSEEERAAMEAERRTRKAWEIARFEERGERVRKVWE